MDEEEINEKLSSIGKHVEIQTTTGKIFSGIIHILPPTGHIYYIDDSGYACVLLPGTVEHIRYTDTCITNVTELLIGEQKIREKFAEELKNKQVKPDKKQNSGAGYS